mgnify:CR=1 FL=1
MNFGLWMVLTVIFTVLALFSVILMICSYSKNDSIITSVVTGLVVIPAEYKNTEIMLRKLASYIEKNDIRCFRKIYIRVDNDDEENLMICRGMCKQFSVFEIVNSC